MNTNWVVEQSAKLLVSGSLIIGLGGCGRDNQTSWEKSEKKSVSGKITLHPKLKARLADTDVMFVMAKGENGPPIAVKKITDLRFPVEYTLTEDDMMLPGMIFPERVFVSARIDKDGNASPAQPGDMEGQHPQNPVTVGKNQVDLEIDKLY